MARTDTTRRTILVCVLLLASTLLTAACATNEAVPVAVSCPPPPPVPQILKQPVSTEPALIVRYQALIQELQDSLKAAIKP